MVFVGRVTGRTVHWAASLRPVVLEEAGAGCGA